MKRYGIPFFFKQMGGRGENNADRDILYVKLPELVGGDFPVKPYHRDRFLHVVFAKLSSVVEKPYQGRYQGQRGVRLPPFK
ncbi:MAG: hypothetical protein QW724_03780 [Nitrososphaerota archaeon]